ncbi:MAG: hypothetical protein SPJ71_01085 [Candidatus Limisoma sp.]|nr:hypothetical protein [Bacteroidales bacterium]MDY5893158.1 hypothetical protein [Candidatus Limisoma sp.]
MITKTDADIYTVDSHILYHDRPSHEARGVGVASFPTLSISDAKRRAYHNRRVSDALHHHRIFDTMMMSTHPQERCSPSHVVLRRILCQPTKICRLIGRTVARPYSNL